MESFIKPRASMVISHPEYSMYGPGPLIAVSGPYDNFSTVILGYG